jgi:hypothetical protein
MTTEESYVRLGEMVEEHHLQGREPDTCDVDAALAEGLNLYAAHLLMSATEVPREMELLYGGVYTDTLFDHEKAEFLNIPRYKCVCTAVVNVHSGSTGQCHNCGREKPREEAVEED